MGTLSTLAKQPAGSAGLKLSPVPALLFSPSFEPLAVALPELGSIEVRVPAARPLTDDEVAAAVRQRAREKVARRERGAGESVALGDDVCIDFIMTCNEQFVPFVIEFEEWRELGPIAGLPGLAEAVAECGVVDRCVQVDIVLPEAFPLPGYGGQPARIVVAIHRAVEVKLPTGELYQAAGLGANLAEARVKLQAEVDALARSRLVVDRLITRALALHVSWEPPAPLVDYEVLCMWAERGGRVSSERGFSVEQQRALLSHWQSATWIREEAVVRLRGAVALRAIAQRDGVRFDELKTADFLALSSEEFGVTAEEVERGLAEASSDQARRAREAAFLQSVLEQVRGQVHIVYGDPPAAP